MHHVPLLYREPGDFPRRESEPKLRYMLATSPRSGSTMIALHLWRTGVMGAPMEYLNFDNSAGIVERLGKGNIITYWNELLSLRTSPNGIFGYKMFVGNYKYTLKKYPDLVPLIAADRVIFLRREDKIAQAVSHARAIQSGAWFAGVEPRRSVSYDFNQLLQCYRLAKQQDQQWEKIFKWTDVEPVRICYEHVLENLDAVLDGLCQEFGVQRNPGDILEHITLTTTQSDAITDEWKARFIDELEKRDDAARDDALADTPPV